jgi:hypothetical protein
MRKQDFFRGVIPEELFSRSFPRFFSRNNGAAKSPGVIHPGRHDLFRALEKEERESNQKR